MLWFRHADPRFPFLWESTGQPAARWHDTGEGPVHYLTDTPDGAWAEFLRHEGITQVEELENVQRALWAVEVPPEPSAAPMLPTETLLGGTGTYEACRAEARRQRAAGSRALVAPSAALLEGGARAWKVDRGLREGNARDGQVLVLFGLRPGLEGWAAAGAGRPRAELLERVRQLDFTKLD